MITNTLPIAITIAVYMSVCLLLGFIAWRRTTNLGDFILGGRSLGSWVTALSAQATDMSGWLLMGLPGLAYLSGFDAVWMALGLTVGTWANWRFVAAPLRARTESLDALTLPDYFERRFDDNSRALRTISAALILIFFIFYTASGFVAAGRLFESLFNLDYFQAMLLGTGAMLAYTFFGGFLAVSWSDVLQGTLMFFALVLVALLGVSLAGGFDEAISNLNAQQPQLLDPWIGDGGAAIGWIGIASMLAWGLGYPGQPHVLARFMAIRSTPELTTSRRVAMSWVITVLFAAVVVGLMGVLVLPQKLTGADVEKVFILTATTYLHPILAGICLAGILAAVMSTAAAQLLVASSAFAQDIYKGLFGATTAGTNLLWIGRFAVLGVAAIAMWIATDPQNTVLGLVSWAWAGFGSAFGPAIVMSLYWPRITRNGALAGMIVGGLTVMLWQRGDGGIFELYEMVPGVILSSMTIWSVSLLSPATARNSSEA